MRVLPAILILLLAACAHSEPGIRVETVQVPVLRVTSCLSAKDIPIRPGPLPKRPKSVSAAVDILLAKVMEWTNYGDKADAVMRGCSAH